MAKLADLIERYLRHLMQQTEGEILEVRRSELAEKFSCAPSQINYVLDTRFTVRRGFLVESRRGEGGYIRIIHVGLHDLDNIHRILEEHLQESIREEEALDIIARLEEEGWITPSHSAMMRVVVRDDTIPLPSPDRDAFRSQILRKMVLQAIRFRK